MLPIFLLLAAGLLAPAATYAQVFDMGTLTNTLTIPTGSSKGSATRPISTATAGFTYAPTAALRASTVQGYVARLKSKEPAAAQAVAAAFGPGKSNYDQVYQGLTKDSGLRENDAADILSTFLIIGWMIANNVQDGTSITVPMARGVRAQVAPLLARNSRLKAPGAAAQVGEEIKLQAVVVQSGWQSAIKEGKLPAYQQGIATLFRSQYGLDLRQLKLTAQGFAGK